ncbi:MAG: hypothetical protein NT154_33140, partial [Verrucomicrobia bacterium]|nr:hypothetical protein [Verrucomicrobiota bacterium]
MQLDAAVYLAAVHQSQGELNSAKAALELAQLNANQLSAVFIVPKDFTADYLAGRPTKLELIKNPADSIHPAFLEEVA